MKTRRVLGAALLGLLLAPPMAFCAQAVPAEAFSAATNSSVEEGDSSTANARDSGLYSDGTRAINEGRWTDAVAIFAKVASEQDEHADGALYWKAYAENKLGQSGVALNTCAELRRDHPKSRWMDECGALEIEIRAKSGQPIQPQAEQNEDLKLLALNSLMNQDELRALPEIQQILNGNFSEKFKERALFILAQGHSKQAQELLEQIAQGFDNPALQAKAAEMLAGRHGQQTGSPALATDISSRNITLDVVVTDRFGKPVAGLQPQDFTLLDNKHPQNILSFHAEDGINAKADAPVEVILLVDGINSSVDSLANTRYELEKYLQQNSGHLALPTSFIFLTDLGAKIQSQPTRDGNTLIADLKDDATSLRMFRNPRGYYNAAECWQLSLTALDRIAVSVGRRPGRKLIVWIGPGWSALARLAWLTTNNQQQGLFDYIAVVATALREARITLYSIDPAGVGHGQFYYENYLKGVATVKQVDYRDLLLQVLAQQTGGLVFFGTNDIASLIARCTADANAYYILSFNPPPASHPNEYHSIEVQIDKPGMRARTRTGYYAQP